jgi:hypothetical protein
MTPQQDQGAGEWTAGVEPCPFCGEALTIPAMRDALARCDTAGCWMSSRAIGIAPDDLRQVAQWNTRAGGDADPDLATAPVALWHEYRELVGEEQPGVYTADDTPVGRQTLAALATAKGQPR